MAQPVKTSSEFLLAAVMFSQLADAEFVSSEYTHSSILSAKAFVVVVVASNNCGVA